MRNADFTDPPSVVRIKMQARHMEDNDAAAIKAAKPASSIGPE